ncbi:MAG: hypothetical protein PHI71_18190 [Acidiphilium sp.]|nr:hypothetical protein [Acidiphilium sp.]
MKMARTGRAIASLKGVTAMSYVRPGSRLARLVGESGGSLVGLALGAIWKAARRSPMPRARPLGVSPRRALRSYYLPSYRRRHRH